MGGRYNGLLAQNINCGYSLEPPRQGGSNEYPQSFEQKYKKYQNFLSENYHFVLVVKFSVYLNRHVFVMCSKHELFDNHTTRSGVKGG